MPSNVEIKARVHDVEALRLKLQALSDTPVQIINQQDTFYITRQGRLKLRVLAPDRCELIHYTRSDDAGAKESNYDIVRSNAPVAFARIMESALPIRGLVTKQRHLYQIGATRVHLDEVDGLGTFLELEVMLSEGQTAEYGTNIANGLMTQLGIEAADLICCAYIDLLENRT